MLGWMLGLKTSVPRPCSKLSARQVETLTRPGRHSDGGGLYLVVDKAGAKRWVFLFRWKRRGEPGPGRLREMGLGSLTSISLAKARRRAAEARETLSEGMDPIEARRRISETPTFGTMADEFIKMRSEGLRNEKSKYRWRRALEVHAASLRPLQVDSVGTEDILKVLQPIWLKTPDAASKVRGYLEAVLDAAKAKGFRSGENPARWRGHLDHLLPRQPKLTRGHHAALPFRDAPAFMAELRARDAPAARALEFLILCAARSGEVIGARWTEVDLKARVWTLPGLRMKGEREHRVPRSAIGACKILASVAVPDGPPDAPVFTGGGAAGGLSAMAFAMLLRRMGRDDLTTHGFRSTFRDWAGETTNFPRELAEAALAHAVGDDVERAYRRGDALEKRRKLMDAWARYCEPKTANVVGFERRT